jgi:succinylglutamate desuccinylase
MAERYIGRYDGQLAGPLLICIGGMHGNEPAGVLAIEEVLRLLEMEPKVNPGFVFQGVLVGLRGNTLAMASGKRFIERDLNRMLSDEEIRRIQHTPEEERGAEDRECLELINTIQEEIARTNASTTLIIDLHTTTAEGGGFTIAADDPVSMKLARGLHAPVILGIADDLQGTTISYFNKPDEQRHCIVFEAGQHQDPQSVHRTVSAIINCMRSMGSVEAKDVDHRHDGLLKRLSNGLPGFTRLAYRYKIQPGEAFDMRPGYRNFQKISRGEVLAHNEHGEIMAPVDGLILMPKYQVLGDDGFFIVQAVE